MTSAGAPAPGWLPPETTVDLGPRGTAWARDTGPADDGRPTLLLLHGWAVTADLNFFTAYRRLADDHRVIAMDHRGHGRGIRPPGGRVRLSDCADDAEAVLSGLGVDRATVVGYSMGGAVAQLLWRRHPERVQGLVLCATARHFQGGPLTDVWYRSQGALATVAHRADAPARRILEARVARRLADEPEAAWMREQLLRTDPSAALSAMSSLGRFRSSSWIQEVSVPAAVLVHGRDRTVPTRRQEQLARAIPGAHRHEIDGPHDAIVTTPERYVPTLVAAIAQVTGVSDISNL